VSKTKSEGKKKQSDGRKKKSAGRNKNPSGCKKTSDGGKMSCGLKKESDDNKQDWEVARDNLLEFDDKQFDAKELAKEKSKGDKRRRIATKTRAKSRD